MIECKKRPLVVCIPCSILVHLVGVFVVGQPRVFEFTTPLAIRPSIAVNLVEVNEDTRREERRKSFVSEPPGRAVGKGSSAVDPGTAGPQMGIEEPALPRPSASVPGSEVQAEMMGPVPAQTPTPENSSPPQDSSIDRGTDARWFGSLPPPMRRNYK